MEDEHGGNVSHRAVAVALPEKQGQEESKRGFLRHAHMLDVSLEGIVQLFVLISLYFIPAVLPRVSGLGAEFEDTNPAWTTWILLVGSPILTLVFTISSILTAVNINKGGQLSLQSQFLFSFSFFCQLASYLFRRVPTQGISLQL